MINLSCLHIKPYSLDIIDVFHTLVASPSADRMVLIAFSRSCCSTSSRTVSIRDLVSLLIKTKNLIICIFSLATVLSHISHEINAYWGFRICLFVDIFHLEMDFYEIGLGESTLKVVRNIYVWSMTVEYNNDF